MSLRDIIKHSWDAFVGRDPTKYYSINDGRSSYIRPDRVIPTKGNERSIITTALNRIAVDASQIDIFHVQLDEQERFLEKRDSKLNYCLSKSANIDQAARLFRQDIFMTMLDEGCVAIVPTETTEDPSVTNVYDIGSLRTAKVIEWYPKKVKVEIYNDKIGEKKEIIVDKKWTAIIENPFYAIMNERNSILQRIVRKLNILDIIDEQSGSGKLDMIIQLPYSIKSDIQKDHAEDRRKSIEKQLSENKFGIAYIDSTEHITQINRPVENKLMGQIEYLINLFYSQIGITQGVLDGTADENTMNNYYNRTIEAILSATVEEMERKWLTKTAITQGQAIRYFRDPFKIVPVNMLPDLMDKLTRNAVITSNEGRQILGLKPASDPDADVLRNKNISQPQDASQIDVNGNKINQNGGYEEDLENYEDYPNY